MGWLTSEQIAELGFASVGKQVLLSDKASFYGCDRIHLGSHVRIDDFCVLSAGIGGINLENHVHIAVYCSLIGGGNIRIADYSGLSSRVSIYSSNDDYSGRFMSGPAVPSAYTQIIHKDVRLDKHVIVGAGSVILPGVHLEQGVAIGALSLVRKSCAEFGIYFGNPAKRIAERKRDMLELARQWRELSSSEES